MRSSVTGHCPTLTPSPNGRRAAAHLRLPPGRGRLATSDLNTPAPPSALRAPSPTRGRREAIFRGASAPCYCTSPLPGPKARLGRGCRRRERVASCIHPTSCPALRPQAATPSTRWGSADDPIPNTVTSCTPPVVVFDGAQGHGFPLLLREAYFYGHHAGRSPADSSTAPWVRSGYGLIQRSLIYPA